ncbi:14509_t:CDS:10 [Funneliformis caledonium]|uniref:Exocyst complex protein EXO70 n=1 Tax=Funneliformis caledonium TaxID=1117310 RepID=A0A9N9HCX8_9GLOM|nr:14509_t:CDS:10 [Funneliformis caledonium]
MDRLDEESADLDFLEENLKKTEALTEKMTGMLNVFDDRLVRLEASILPIHKSTQTLTKLEDNIDKTRNGVLEIIGFFDLVEREEMTIKKGINESELECYLNSIGKCKKAMEVLGGMRLKSSEKVIGQLKQILKAGMLQLEEHFRLCLTNRSNTIEPLSYITKNLDIPGIPNGPLQNLATLSSYLATSGPELGYNSDFVKAYIEVRSNYLAKSLNLLAQGSISTAEKRSTLVYEKGTSDKILPPGSVMSGFRGAIQMPLDNYIETGRTLNNRVKKNMQTDVFLAFDMMESLNKNSGSFEEVFRLAGKKDSSYGDLLHSLRAAALRSFPEFIDEIKNHRTKTTNLPNDGTVHELTSTTLQHLKRLTDYQEIVETMLLTLGDGNWNVSEKEPNFSRDRTVRGMSANAILQHYFADVLESLTITLDFKAKSYKKTALTCIFLLNNYHYVLKSIRTQFFSILEEIGYKYEKMVKRYNDGYLDTWKPCFANLMDSVVRGGTLKTALSNEKGNVKEKFKNFNTEFEEMYKVHKGYAIPDLELRSQVIKDIKMVLMPMYIRFLEKHQQSEFSKNPTKYIKYDPQSLENLVNRLFDGSIN